MIFGDLGGVIVLKKSGSGGYIKTKMANRQRQITTIQPHRMKNHCTSFSLRLVMYLFLFQQQTITCNVHNQLFVLSLQPCAQSLCTSSCLLSQFCKNNKNKKKIKMTMRLCIFYNDISSTTVNRLKAIFIPLSDDENAYILFLCIYFLRNLPN